MLDRLETTAIGRRRGAGVTVRRGAPAGCILFGPYWRLPAGRYRLRFAATSGRPRMAGQPVLGVEVIALNRLQQIWRDFTAEELNSGRRFVEFAVPPGLASEGGEEALFEFRFFHLGNAGLAVAAVDLHRLGEGDEEAAAPPLASEWRLLGRLESPMIGTRRDGRVLVRRGRPAGRVLAGGRPPLLLPKGRYRLSFECRAGPPRWPTAPVLAVEIAAVGRWRRRAGCLRLAAPGEPEIQLAGRDLTAVELAGGSGSLEFAVPASLALEAGGDARFDVRFVHLGNADLAVEAVTLRRLMAEAESPAPAREWRLSSRLVPGRAGRREGDGVSVRRGEAAGVILEDVRPDLVLPAGRYRLAFRGRAGTAQDLPRPVLDVAVIARRRSTFRWREAMREQARAAFTAEDLQGGAAAIEFSVPEGLGCEAEAPARFAFRFRHLGNADLRLGAVTLRTVEAEGRPAAPALGRGRGRRRKAVVIGNCQALTVQEALARARSLNSRLDARYQFVGLPAHLHDEGRRELAEADVLLVQEIRDWADYPLRGDIPDGVPIVRFPLLHFASPWPFDFYNGPSDREAYAREWPNLTFPYLDGLLGRLRREIPDKEERFRAYAGLAVDGVVNYVRLHDFERRRLLAMDRRVPTGIGRYILDNFQKKQIFYTTNHPNSEIFALLMRYLLRELAIDERYRPTASLDHLRRQQVPVHPKVAQALGVRWADERTRYLYGGSRVTWEQYIRRYIDHYG